MADSDPVNATAGAMRRIMAATRRVETGGYNERGRQPKGPIPEGGGDGCTSQNAQIDITVAGRITGGTIVLNQTVDGTSEPLTFNWDDDATAAKAVFESHTKIAVDNVIVTGGPLPNTTLRVEFVENLANTDIALPTADWRGATGGLGVAVICAYAQRGHSG